MAVEMGPPASRQSSIPEQVREEGFGGARMSERKARAVFGG